MATMRPGIPGRDSSPGVDPVRIVAMRLTPVLTLIVSTTLVAGLGLALRTGAMPLGVKGEWEWLRLPVGPSAIDVMLAVAGVGVYASLAGAGMSLLGKRTT